MIIQGKLAELTCRFCNKPAALVLLSPLQAAGALRKSKSVSRLKASNRRCKQRDMLLR